MNGGGILAFDLGRRLGWAAASAESCLAWPPAGALLAKGPFDGLTYGTEYLGDAGFHLESRRMGALFAFMERKQQEHQPQHVVFERPFIDMRKPSKGQQQNVKLAGLVDGYFSARGASVWHVEIASVKKSFAGHGRASKDDVVFVCRRRGWTPPDDNSADALAVLDHFIHQLRAAERRSEIKRRGAA